MVSGVKIQLPHTFFVNNENTDPIFVRLMSRNKAYIACIYELVGRTASQGLFRTQIFVNSEEIYYKVIDGLGMLGISFYNDINYVYVKITQYCSCTIQCIGTSDMNIIHNPQFVDVDVNNLSLI